VTNFIENPLGQTKAASNGGCKSPHKAGLVLIVTRWLVDDALG
jgi:hypothetical protein